MRFSLFDSIRKSLVVLVLLSIFPALGIILYMGQELRTKLVQDAEGYVLREVQAMGTYHERIVDNARLLLMTLAKATEIRNLDARAAESLLKDMRIRHPVYVSLALADADGRVVAAVPEVFAPSEQDEKYFSYARRKKGFVVGDYHLDPAERRVVVRFVQPVFKNDDQVVGFLMASFDLSYFGTLFSEARLPPRSIFTLTDADGIRLTRFPEAEKYTWVADLPKMVAHMSGAEEEGSFLEIGVDGVHRLYGYKRMHFQGATFPYLMIRLGIPVRETFAAAENVLVRSAVLLVTAAVMALGLAFLVGRMAIMRRMDSLIGVTKRLEAGDLTVRSGIPPRGGELGQLATAFDSMAAGLEQKEKQRQLAQQELLRLNEELEQRVDLRTKQLREVNGELQHTLEDLHQTQDQLVMSGKLAALAELVAGVAHEINTPVGVALSAASALKEKKQQMNELFTTGEMKRSDLARFLEETEEGMTMINLNLVRASELVRSFKMVAADQVSESRRLFKVKEYIDELLISLRPKLKKTRIQVEVDCDAELTVESYPGALSQVLTNFIINSLIHGFAQDQEGLIIIRANMEQAGGTLVLNYQDNGRGMEPEVRAKIFEPFFTTARGQGSTGLGLPIVFNIITSTFGGTIDCESVPGRGTRFIVRIPAHTSDKESYHG